MEVSSPIIPAESVLAFWTIEALLDIMPEEEDEALVPLALAVEVDADEDVPIPGRRRLDIDPVL